MGRAIVSISPELILSCFFPKRVLVSSLRINHMGYYFEMEVEHEDLPEVSSGEDLPHVDLWITEKGNLHLEDVFEFKWDIKDINPNNNCVCGAVFEWVNLAERCDGCGRVR